MLRIKLENKEVIINKVELLDILGKKENHWNNIEQKNSYKLDINKQIPTDVYFVKRNNNKCRIVIEDYVRKL